MLMRASDETLLQQDLSQTAIDIRGLTMAYGEELILPGVDLSIPLGSRFAILGPNGAGKSTLLKAILGLVAPQAGRVRFPQAPQLSADSAKANGLVAYVPQRASVDWHFPATAMDVVSMGRFGARRWYQRLSRQDRERAAAALEAVGLTRFADHALGALSGGQAQRVFLARAIAQDAQIFLLDEPLTGIDAPSQDIIIDQLHQLNAQGKTVVAVHHDLKTAGDIFSHGALLNRGLVASGLIQDVCSPQALASAFGLPIDALWRPAA